MSTPYVCQRLTAYRWDEPLLPEMIAEMIAGATWHVPTCDGTRAERIVDVLRVAPNVQQVVTVPYREDLEAAVARAVGRERPAIMRHVIAALYDRYLEDI